MAETSLIPVGVAYGLLTKFPIYGDDSFARIRPHAEMLCGIACPMDEKVKPDYSGLDDIEAQMIIWNEIIDHVAGPVLDDAIEEQYPVALGLMGIQRRGETMYEVIANLQADIASLGIDLEHQLEVPKTSEAKLAEAKMLFTSSVHREMLLLKGLLDTGMEVRIVHCTDAAQVPN